MAQKKTHASAEHNEDSEKPQECYTICTLTKELKTYSGGMIASKPNDVQIVG